jgi:hypothetical protein
MSTRSRLDRLERRLGTAVLSEHDLMMQSFTDEELSELIAMCKARLIQLGHDPDTPKRAQQASSAARSSHHEPRPLRGSVDS